jgi:hypothetical protein
MDFLSDCMAWRHLDSFPCSENIWRSTTFPDIVVNVSDIFPRSQATRAKRYDGFLNGSFHFVKCVFSSISHESIRFPFERRIGYFLDAMIVVVNIVITSGRSRK